MADETTVDKINEQIGLLGDHVGDLYERTTGYDSQLETINAQLRQLLESGQSLSGSGTASAIMGIFTQQAPSASIPSIVTYTQNNVRGFYRIVRDWVLQVNAWDTAIRYQTLPDERWDMTLVSQRVYGNRHEFMTVLAAAGLDTLEQELTERLLILPTEPVLDTLKRKAGYVSRPYLRSSG